MGKEGKEEKRTEATEGGKPGRRAGRPPGPPLSEDEQKQKTKAKNDKYRGKIKLEREERETFCEMPGINYMFKPFSEEYRKRNEESSKMQNLLKKCEGFCKEPRIIDKFKAYSEKCRKRIDETTKKWQELFNKFFEEEGITKKFEAICSEVEEEEERKFKEEFNKLCEVWDPSDHCFLDLLLQTGELEGVTAMNSSSSRNLEMIQTGGLEGVTAVNSSSFEAVGTPFERAGELKRKREEEPDGTHRGKRPATAYTTPSRSPIVGQILSWEELEQKTFEGLSLDDVLDVTRDSSDWDTFFDSLLEPEMPTGNLAASSNVASGAMNSTATGGEPHHDPLAKQGGTTAAGGSSGGHSTQSPPHNEKF